MPGDPVENILASNGFDLDRVTNTELYDIEYQRIAKENHFDLPIFYIGISSSLKENNAFFHYPTIHINGLENQYHYWATRFIKGELGNSSRDGNLVIYKIAKALSWTISLALTALISVILLGIPLGVYLFKKKPKTLQLLLYGVYSIPVFWMATLFLIFLTTPEYGAWTNLFPTPGIWDENTTWWQAISSSFTRLILPLLCIIIHDLTYLSRMTFASMQAESSKPYINTSLSKGLSEDQVDKKHILPNAILPIVTIIIDAIPRSLAGTLIIEVIFNLPGMGRLLFTSIQNQDWNVLISILMLISIVTVITYIIGDLIYSKINPKIELN